jgi:hypothetical protein
VTACPSVPRARGNSGQQQSTAVRETVPAWPVDRPGSITQADIAVSLICPARHDATAPSHRQRGRRKWHPAAVVTCREPLDSLVMRHSKSNGGSVPGHARAQRQGRPRHLRSFHAPTSTVADLGGRTADSFQAGHASSIHCPHPAADFGGPGARSPSAARRNSHGAAVRVKITRAERDQLAPAVNAVTSTRAGRSIAGSQRDRLAEGANQSPGRGLLFEARDASRLCASQLVRHLPEVYQSKRSCMVRHTASSS